MNDKNFSREILLNSCEESTLGVLNEYVKAIYYSKRIFNFSANANIWLLQ